MDICTAIRTRTSVRSYTTAPVNRETLARLIQLANQAPLFGALHFSILVEKAVLEQITQATVETMRASGNEFLVKRAAQPGYTPLHGAPVLVLVSARGGQDTQGFNMASAACAAENLMLAATGEGLGSCLVMTPLMALAEGTALHTALALPEGFVPLCGVVLGHPTATALAPVREKQNYSWI